MQVEKVIFFSSHTNTHTSYTLHHDIHSLYHHSHIVINTIKWWLWTSSACRVIITPFRISYIMIVREISWSQQFWQQPMTANLWRMRCEYILKVMGIGGPGSAVIEKEKGGWKNCQALPRCWKTSRGGEDIWGERALKQMFYIFQEGQRMGPCFCRSLAQES